MCSLAQGCPSPSLWPHRQGSFPLMLKPNQLRSGYRILTSPAMSEREQRANRYRQSMWMYCVWTHYGLCASECVRDFIHSKVTYHNLYTVTHSSSNAHRHGITCRSAAHLFLLSLLGWSLCFVGTCRYQPFLINPCSYLSMPQHWGQWLAATCMRVPVPLNTGWLLLLVN